ncbi:MAG: hypothetical protein EAZ37_03200 [Burkholderiales bacterium]|nr:MAG: hypothetical protein EAZ37_03200 [Burkholderiales bacterium]
MVLGAQALIEATPLQHALSLRFFGESTVAQDSGWINIDTAPWHLQAAQLPSGPVELSYRCWTSQRGQVRLMTLHGAKVSVESLFLLPNTSYDWPTLAAETVVLGNTLQVAVLDVVAPPTISTRAWQCALNRTRPFHDKELPGWFESCASGHEIFLRKPHELAMTAYWQSVTMCINEWASKSALNSLANREQTQDHHVWLEAYMEHHRDNSPGLPLLSRLFGENWTREFMQNFFEVSAIQTR